MRSACALISMPAYLLLSFVSHSDGDILWVPQLSGIQDVNEQLSRCAYRNRGSSLFHVRNMASFLILYSRVRTEAQELEYHMLLLEDRTLMEMQAYNAHIAEQSSPFMRRT